jgi:hypothetical protein
MKKFVTMAALLCSLLACNPAPKFVGKWRVESHDPPFDMQEVQMTMTFNQDQTMQSHIQGVIPVNYLWGEKLHLTAPQPITIDQKGTWAVEDKGVKLTMSPDIISGVPPDMLSILQPPVDERAEAILQQEIAALPKHGIGSPGYFEVKWESDDKFILGHRAKHPMTLERSK